MYKILVSGYYGFHNIGDEAVLRCVTEQIRHCLPEAELTILSNDPQDTQEKYQVKSIPRMCIHKVIAAIFKTDMLISGGGSLLQDVTSRNSILYYLMIILLGLLFRKRVFIYSQGIGPIHGKMNRRLTAFLLKRVDGIAVRDEKSARLLTEIGVPPEKVCVTADPVLGLHPADPALGKQILEQLGLQKSTGRPLVGWAIKAGDEAFLEQVAQSVRYLKEIYQAESIFIPFHYEQDAKVIETLSEQLGEDAYYVKDKHLIDEMLSLIGNLDLLIGVRLHSLIYAAVAGVPMLGISYDPKIDAFLESISCTCVSSTRDFSLQKLAPAVDDVLAHQQETVAQTNTRVAQLRQRLNQNEEMVLALAKPKTQPKAKKKSGVASVIGGVMLITVLAKVFGILRESVQASVFGAADAYYAGYNKTIYLFTTAAYAMCVAAVPIITKEMEKSRKDGMKAANNLTTISLLLSFLALGLWELFTLNPFAGIYGSDPNVLPFVRVMALSLPVIVAAYLMVALFQSLDHFTLQGSMSLPHSILLIGYLVLFGKQDRLMTYVWLVCLAWVLQFLMCLPYAIKEKYRFRPQLDLRCGYLGTFTKTSLVNIVATSTYLFCYLLDASSAQELGAGTTSAFYYADKLFTPLATTFIYSISSVMFPKLSREYTKNQVEDYKKYVWDITSSTLVVILPLCALLMVFGGPILKVLFESGNFTPENTAATTDIFVVYVLGMVGFAAMDLVNKAFFTMGRSLAPLLISLFTVFLDFLLNALVPGEGAFIALTTAISITAGAVVTLIVMFRGEKILYFVPILKSLVASGAAGLAAWVLKSWFVSMEEGKILLILKCGSIGVAAMGVFLLLCVLLRLDTVTDVLKKLKK